MRKIILTIVLVIILSISVSHKTEARRGCCSWHGGVAGCSSNGRQICRDGTLSPTCTCLPNIKKQYENKVFSQGKIIKATRMSDSEFCLTWLDL